MQRSITCGLCSAMTISHEVRVVIAHGYQCRLGGVDPRLRNRQRNCQLASRGQQQRCLVQGRIRHDPPHRLAACDESMVDRSSVRNDSAHVEELRRTAGAPPGQAQQDRTPASDA
jgi:hypothetical protein